MRRVVFTAAAIALLIALSACRAQWEEDCLKNGGYPNRGTGECEYQP